MIALRNIKLQIILAVSINLASCSKKEFLDVKPSEVMAVPRTVEHFIAMMDNDGAMNGAGGFNPLYPSLPDVASDDNWVPDIIYTNNLLEVLRAAYVWQAKPYPAMSREEWTRPYANILSCNVVLEGLEKVRGEQMDMNEWKLAKGMALFHRSHAYTMLLSMFAPAYIREYAADQAGVPLRNSSDLSETIVFASLEDNYRQLLADLTQAIDLLPTDPLYKTRPSKRSCWALLSRVYLWMSHFEESNYYANLALDTNGDLLDYNEYSTTANYPFPRFNAEVIFNCNMNTSASIYMRIDTTLYKAYDSNDLRRSLFFKPQATAGGHRFIGNYDGTVYVFAGLANDELYLTRAETYARVGKVDLAIDDLNKLLQTRYRKIGEVTTFVPYTVTDQEQAIKLILNERRKQLVWRGLRWMDLKRLNLESAHAKVLSRRISNDLFELQPGDPRYVFPIPDPVTDLNPNLKK